MLHFNKDYFPTDGLTKDLMDSAVRIGILMMYGVTNLKCDIKKYEPEPGVFIRGPEGTAANPKNYTRDNMLLYVAGLNSYKLYEPIRRFFWKRAKNFFFMPNTERDEEGSIKLPCPHYFYKDSIPSTVTYPARFKHWRFQFFEHSIPGCKTEKRYFDGPDPLFPQYICFLIIAGRIWQMYWLALILMPFVLLDLAFSSGKGEQSQRVAMCFIFGKLYTKAFVKLNPEWIESSKKYFIDRGEIEYHNFCVEIMDRLCRK